MNFKFLPTLRAVQIAAVAALALLASITTYGQTASPAAAPDGTKARAVLGLAMDHASISVADIQKEAAWYINTLGYSFTPGQGIQKIGGKMQGTRLVIPGFQLDLIQYEGSKRPETPNPIFMQQGYFHLAMTVSDPEAAFNFLQAAGVEMEPSRNRQTNKVTKIVLHDPEGNEIELNGR